MSLMLYSCIFCINPLPHQIHDDNTSKLYFHYPLHNNSCSRISYIGYSWQMNGYQETIGKSIFKVGFVSKHIADMFGLSAYNINPSSQIKPSCIPPHGKILYKLITSVNTLNKLVIGNDGITYDIS